MQQTALIFSLGFSLFILMDPIGNVPIYAALVKELPPKRQQVIIIRELLIALGVIIAFHFLGEALLALLGISTTTVRLAGGIILFIIALKLIFPKTKDTSLEFSDGGEPFIVPLAIPLVAGPSVLAAVMIYSGGDFSSWIVIGAIAVAWIASTIILIASPFLQKVLGKRTITAGEKLMGLILALIAVQMFLEGVQQFISQ